MSNNAAGLSIQDAFSQAEAEGALTEEPSEEPVSSPAEPETPSDEEQSAVESNERQSLFMELVDDEEDQSEQPIDLDSQMVEVTIDGQTEQVTVEEARLGYQRQKDYTKGMQEVADMRKEAESALALYEALQTNPRPTLQRLWDSLRSGEPLVETPAPQENPRELPDIEALLEQKLNERLASDPRLTAIEEQRAVDSVNAIFDDLEGLYDTEISDEDRAFVLDKAMQAGTTDIGLVFGGLMKQRELRAKQRSNAVSNSTSTGYGGQQAIGTAPKAPPKHFSSFREAMNDTFAEEGVDAKALDAAVANL